MKMNGCFLILNVKWFELLHLKKIVDSSTSFFFVTVHFLYEIVFTTVYNYAVVFF